MALPTISVQEFDALIKRCTNEMIPNGEVDLPVALEISDVIRSRRIPPKEAMRCLKKRAMETRNNQNLQFSVWRLVEVCMKNGGVSFLKEICSREFMDCLEQVILSESTDYELEQYCSRLVAELYLAFKNDSQLNYVVKVYQKLMARGIDMDNLKPNENLNAMFDAKTPADWIDSDACMICSNKFTLLNRKHHCRSCGGVFCQIHSSKSIPLPDLGIFEAVRVCDNCFDDYDLKRSSSKGKKRKSKKKAPNQSDNEDEDLRRVIELSLKENGPNVDTFIPKIPTAEPVRNAEEDDDPELKAAIEASLREHQEQERRRAFQQSPQSVNVAPTAPNVSTQPNYDLSSADEEDIHLFASLVERMKNQPPTAILEDTQLQQLYQKVLGVRPRLNYTLNDTVSKYNSVYEMSGKISDIMNMYDSMLERQLRNISISQQYSVPEPIQSPYSYYQNVPQTNKPSYQRETEPAVATQSQPQPPSTLQHPESVSQEPQFLPNGVVNVPNQPSLLSNPQLSPIGNPSVASQLEGLILDQPSEPPYPDDSINTEQKEQNNSAERPYPDDDRVKQDNITAFDFPTVPQRKLSLHESEPEVTEEPEQEIEQEQLLIEL